MDSEDPIRVLVVDDHPVVRAGLRGIIGMCSDMTVVAEAGDGREAVARFREHRPDITLMDLRMPILDGVEAIESIRKEDPEARVIVLTTYDGDEDIFRALKAGAQGYLLKGSIGEALVEAIYSVMAAETCIPAEITARLAERSALSERELEVLRLIAKGLNNREIGEALGVTTGTTKLHVKSILRKLQVGARTEATMVAIQRGILHVEDN